MTETKLPKNNLRPIYRIFGISTFINNCITSHLKTKDKTIVSFFCLLPFTLCLFTPLSPNKELNKPLVFVAPPPPPDIGEPSRRTETGTRSCEHIDQTSALKNKQITALVPLYSDSEVAFGATIAEHPTLWFYIPYNPPFAGKFVLRDKAGKLVYETNVALPKKPGVISLTFPSATAPLEIGKSYHWYFKVYCQPQQLFVFVDGWVQRERPSTAFKNQLQKATPRDRIFLYAAHGIWSEALTAAATLRRTNPKNTDWATLLQAVDLDIIASEPIVE